MKTNLFAIFAFTMFAPYVQAHPLLDLLNVSSSTESVDYIHTKQQFQLHSLVTEQRHPKTWNLSFSMQSDTKSGLDALFSVDENMIVEHVGSYDFSVLEQAARSVARAILDGKKIYVYGCGATGRLAKQLESCFWRPFWEKLENSSFKNLIREKFPNIQNRLIGEITGGDRALISSLEGFEDLQLIGRLQLEDHNIKRGDVVFAVTEGGETSSVIGAILAAANQYNGCVDEAKQHLYFMYNNPDNVLFPLDRSRFVLNQQSISKISLVTGPQAVTGSTRMQATTIGTFAMGMILEQAITYVLGTCLDSRELYVLGLHEMCMKDRFEHLTCIQKAVQESSSLLAPLTDLEAETYRNRQFATYFAKEALIPVFIDSTERSPTFRLSPLDTCQTEERKSWIQVWTPAADLVDAWQSFLKRPFRGLEKKRYEFFFEKEIEDPFLKASALRSIQNAGDEQQFFYDFSYAEPNVQKRGPSTGDLGVLIVMEEELNHFAIFEDWLHLCTKNGARTAIIVIGTKPTSLTPTAWGKMEIVANRSHMIPVWVPCVGDPIGVRKHVALKMLLNAHSTAVMAKLGRVVGNTMTCVNPGNLKLIGRATYLIQSHINDMLADSEKLSYPEANTLLFDAIGFVKSQQKIGVYSEVPLCIVRILEAARTNTSISWTDAQDLLERMSLGEYLQGYCRD